MNDTKETDTALLTGSGLSLLANNYLKAKAMLDQTWVILSKARQDQEKANAQVEHFAMKLSEQSKIRNSKPLTLQDKIAIISACARGEKIQYRNIAHVCLSGASIPAETEWLDCIVEPEFNFSHKEYRVKPEPRHFWISAPTSVDTDGTQVCHIYPTKKIADQRVTGGSAACTEVIEVIK